LVFKIGKTENLAPDLSVLVSVETTSFPAPFPREKALGTGIWPGLLKYIKTVQRKTMEVYL